ncbi:cyclic lactone autoinducer peptide [Paenibacillus sp. FSL P4-0176]|nr:cyclic lactone autoinducer peptide [Paenibacillus sp. 1781tsa1]MCP1185025.1 cyclic lactone autoinducer peptide [Paenibacillus sp. 1781tsa1]
MIKLNFMKFTMTMVGFALSAIAYAGVNTASWTLIHSEPVPEEMK